MLNTIRASFYSCTQVTRLTAAVLQNTMSLHTSTATSAVKTESIAIKKSTKKMKGVADPRYYWIQPVQYKPPSGWLYQLVPASAEDMAAPSAPTRGRSMKPKMPFEVKNGLPKKAITAYQAFFDEKYPEVKRKNPTLTPQDLSKAVGEQWKKSDPKERGKFDKVALKDQERYAKELATIESHRATVPTVPIQLIGPDLMKPQAVKAPGSEKQQKKRKQAKRKAGALKKLKKNAP